MKQAPWTDQENIAGLALYFVMLDSATAGKPYNKAALIRQFRGEHIDRTNLENDEKRTPLSNRSRGSIEAKLMNMSAAHRDIDPSATTMAGFGYVPLANYQSSLKVAMLAYISRRSIDRNSQCRAVI